MVYIHVPFCRSFCVYCDFYSEIACGAREAEAVEAYLECLLKEIESRREEIAESRKTNTLYIGGGTPSVLPLSAFERIVGALGAGPYSEFTVEVNPDDVVRRGMDFLAGLRRLGVDRISMGVQSLSDPMLRWMRRRHTAGGAREAFRMLREAGFANVSVDVIFGINGLSDATLAATLDEIVGWRPEHISAYQLSIEEGSELAAMVSDGRYSELDDESCRRQYDLICARLREAGYAHYEISNWAVPGFEAKHNSAYWTREPYVGLGPGAHSLRISGGLQKRSWNSCEQSGWSSECETLSEDEIREERLMLGLRTAAGVDGRRIPEESWFVSDDIIAGLL